MEVLKAILELILKLFGKKSETGGSTEESDGETGSQSEPQVSEGSDQIEEVEESQEDETKNTDQDMSSSHDYSNIIVCLDNGHAESTPGKRSPYSCCGVEPALPFREYAWAREEVAVIAEKLKDLGFGVEIITPEVKEDIALTTRYKRANKIKTDNPDKKCIFISVHANAHGNGKEWTTAKGWECYTTKGQTNSDKLAECMYEVAIDILPEYGLTVRTDKSDGDYDKEDNFTVIYGANMPAVLTENFFYTNVNETKFILSDEGKEVVAKIHVDGIRKFVEQMYGC